MHACGGTREGETARESAHERAPHLARGDNDMALRSVLPPPVGPRGLRGLSTGGWPSAAFFFAIAS